MSEIEFTNKIENYVINYLYTENAYLRANVDYLKTFTWVQKDSFFLPFRQLEEVSEIRKMKKNDYRKAFKVIKENILDEDYQINALADKIKDIINSSPLPLDYKKSPSENTELTGVQKFMRVYPVVIIKSELHEGYSILYGKGRVGAALVENALRCKVDIEDATAYLNCFYGRRKG